MVEKLWHEDTIHWGTNLLSFTGIKLLAGTLQHLRPITAGPCSYPPYQLCLWEKTGNARRKTTTFSRTKILRVDVRVNDPLI